jgi:subtilisin family serine protease
MTRKRSHFGPAVFLLALLLLATMAHLPGAQIYPTEKISRGLEAELEAAGPDEIVSAVVKLRAVPRLEAVRGDRTAVFAELRRHAAVSQADLMTYLDSPDVRGKVELTRQFWIDNMVLVKTTPDVIQEIANRRDVEQVFENFEFTLPPRPKQPEGPQRSAMQTQSQLWDSITKIGAKQVWTTYGFDGTGVRVGGLDTGVDISHPDIAGKMVTNNPADPTYPGGWAEFDGDGNIVPGSVPHDSDEHGTHTSGTMIGGNASGYDIGVAPGANLMHGLVIPGGSGTFTQVAAGMEWIVDPDNNPATDDGADVVNMSLGATGTYPQMIAPTDNMVAANVFPSFAIGNSGPASGSTSSPGNVPSAYGVGATDSLDVIASFSGRGPVTWNSPPYVGTYIKPDISAPGVKIYSSIPGGDWQWTSSLGDWSGTSMATPHISGTVALMLQANPLLDVATTKLLLDQSAIDLGAAGKDNDYGWGRVNAFSAVSAAVAGVGTLEGTVYSSAGGTVENARVHILDTSQKVYSDATGYYSLQLAAGDHEVEVSRFGYETSTDSVTIVADATTTHDVTLAQLPSGTIAGVVTDSETGAGIETDVTVLLGGEAVLTTATDPTTGAYSVVLPIGTYDLVFHPVFPYPLTTRTGIDVLEGATTTVDVALLAAQILIVDDDGGDPYQTYYEQAAMAAGRSYITVTTPPTAADMAPFESVVWLTGDDYTTTLTSDDQAELAAYLDGGGRLFISGQDIGYDIHTTSSFYADYLHATYVQDDVKLGAVIGEASSPVGVGFAFDIKGGDGANNQAYASEVDPISPALTAFVYDPSVPEAVVTSNTVQKQQLEAEGITSSGTAGLTVDNGTYRLVYFAFGFEAIATASDRSQMMDRILDWLQGYPEIVHTPLGDTEDTVNPYRVSAFITSDYFPLDPSSFAVTYDVGGPETSVPMTATGVPDEYEAYIPAMPVDTEVSYYISAGDVEEHVSTDPIGAPAFKHSFLVAKDEVPPDVVHQEYYDTNDLEGPYGITCEVSDNIGVEAVFLMFAKNGGIHHRVTMSYMGSTGTGDGIYYGEIPGPSEVGDFYDYHIYAMDESYSGNVTRVPETGAYEFSIVEEFVWNFEADDGGWVPMGGVWEWGSPTSGPGDAHSGVNVWATDLDADHGNNMNATLDVPPITISASQPYALFSFWHWYDFETRYDGGNVKVSIDGGATWTIVDPFSGYDDIARSTNAGIPNEPCFTGHDGDYWHQELFDLSAFAGQQVMIRLHAGSDGSVDYPGWYVDDASLRSTATDEYPPLFTDVSVPASTFDTSGPYEVSATVRDPFSGVGAVSILYSLDGGSSYMEIPMDPGVDPDEYVGEIPGLPAGSRVRLYLRATDSASMPNESFEPPGAPGETYAFSILPSAPNLVLVTSTLTSLDMFRDALEANGHEADYWNSASQGWLPYDKLVLYKTIIMDERGSLATQERADLGDFLEAGTLGARKRIFLMGRDLGFYSSTRPWIEEYMRAAYVQDNPGYRELTGEADDPIGVGETFVISGSYPDETQRSLTYPGGTIVYRYTGEGSTEDQSYEAVRGAYEKEGKEWDGIMPQAPKSLDAAAGIKYSSEQYRSVYFTFNFEYIQEPPRRAAIADRVLRWLSAPEIQHTPLADTEDTLSAYTATAMVYSDNLDPTRVKLTYDVGAGPVVVLMTPTGNPDEYSGDIPPQSFGTTVNYYISAANLDGTLAYHPAGAPTDQHSFLVSSDSEPPVISHVPHPNTADLVGPYTIEATITDNVGVDPASVRLTYSKNGGSNVTVPMSSIGGDVYAADIPGPSVLGDLYNYFIIARDVAAVPNTAREPHTGYHSFEIVDYYAWDFEADDGGFTPTGSEWEWGEPVGDPDSAHSGLNVWGTDLDANYEASSEATLDLPEVGVPSSGTHAVLSFWQWYYMQQDDDGGNVKISTDDGATWTILTPDIGYNGTADPDNAGIAGEPCFTGLDGDVWHRARFDLTPYKGQNVRLRLHFGSDPYTHYEGWYVDDFRIEGAEDTEPPSFASTDVPISTFDETGPYTVTTVVRDLLAGISTLVLHYSTDGGSSWTQVAMTPTGNPDEYSGDIPGQPQGTRIKLYLEATDNAANTSTDPAGAPGVTYEFGIMPSGDYLVLLGGVSHTDPVDYQLAFSAIGRTADIWDWDDLGVPTVAQLHSYQGVIVDESWYFDTTQKDTLGAFLATDDGTPQQIFFLGRDMSYGSSARPWMEEHTGAAYVKDDPGFRELTSTPGDPIGADETFSIQGFYPDELRLSTTYTGGQVVYRYSGPGSSLDRFDTEQEWIEFYQDEGKAWDSKLWPMVPSGPDSAAAVRWVGPHHASVYFAFQLNYVQEASRRAGILDRALDWLSSASFGPGKEVTARNESSDIPDELTLWQNTPNPFNPVTTIRLGIPQGARGEVSLKIYDVQGRLVKTLFDGTKDPGIHTFVWEGRNNRGHRVSSGIYFYRMEADEVIQTRKMILLK